MLQDSPALPLAYFITFRTYGTWLPGDARGSTPRWRRTPGTPLDEPHEGFRRAAERRLVNVPVVLDSPRRLVVHRGVMDACDAQRWAPLAVAVCTNHVHVVLSGPCPPETMMSALKAWSTRRLREQELVPREHRMWSRHGSTRYLWCWSGVEAACAYVQRHEQGGP